MYYSLLYKTAICSLSHSLGSNRSDCNPLASVPISFFTFAHDSQHLIMKTTALLCLLTATSALAAPGTIARKARHDRRMAEGIRSQPMIPANITGMVNGPENKYVQYSTNWAGAALVGSGYTGVTGTFTIPTPKAPTGANANTPYSASAWVGLDGYTCGSAILQTGVDFTIQNGAVSFDAWYEWYPDYAYDFSGITFSVGDVVTLTIKATSKTGGTGEFISSISSPIIIVSALKETTIMLTPASSNNQERNQEQIRLAHLYVTNQRFSLRDQRRVDRRGL